jgi:hypothetical protein
LRCGNEKLLLLLLRRRRQRLLRLLRLLLRLREALDAAVGYLWTHV